MSCSTISGLPLLGCCGPANPCPADQLHIFSSVQTRFTVVGSSETSVHFDQADTTWVMQEAVNRVAAISLDTHENTILESQRIYGSPLRIFADYHIFPQAQGNACGASASAFSSILETAFGTALSLQKIRVICARPFCVQTFLNVAFNVLGNPNYLDGILQRFEPGIYDIIPPDPVPVLGALDPQTGAHPITGSSAIFVYSASANYAPCNALLNG